MIPGISKRVLHRAAALGMLVLAGVLLEVGVWMPLRDWRRSLDDAIFEAADSRARVHRALQLDQMAASALAPADIAQYRVDFLVGEQESIVLAALQTRVRALVLAQGAELRSARPLPATTVDRTRYVGLNLLASGELHGIFQIVYAIEFGTPLLFVERAVIRPDTLPGVMSTAGGKAPRILLELNVVGALWSKPTATGPELRP